MGVRRTWLTVLAGVLALAVGSVTGCGLDAQSSSDDELRRTTADFFAKASAFSNEDSGPDGFNSVADLSAWHRGNEQRLADLRASFNQWSRTLDRSGAPGLLRTARDRFGAVNDDFKEQVDGVRDCIDRSQGSLERAGSCVSGMWARRSAAWERNYRAAYQAWEEWRSSAG
jgi:hypothetical protein